MRIASLAPRLIVSLCLLIWAGLAAALDVEANRLYPGTGPVTVKVLSTTDLDLFEPIILRFQEERPEIGIDYTVVSSAEAHRAILEGASFDLVLSSAMDLQFQLANDGLAQSYASDATEALPDWARWRDLVFAFTSEPAVTVISAARWEGLPEPQTRQDLIALLRDNPERFAGAVGTYDVRSSGLGYSSSEIELPSNPAMQFARSVSSTTLWLGQLGFFQLGR